MKRKVDTLLEDGEGEGLVYECEGEDHPASALISSSIPLDREGRKTDGFKMAKMQVTAMTRR